MYVNITSYPASSTARVRMSELCLGFVAEPSFQGRVSVGVVALGIVAATPAPTKDVASGVPAWRPPV
jgi:hypothetical protein